MQKKNILKLRALKSIIFTCWNSTKNPEKYVYSSYRIKPIQVGKVNIIW